MCIDFFKVHFEKVRNVAKRCETNATNNCEILQETSHQPRTPSGNLGIWIRNQSGDNLAQSNVRQSGGDPARSTIRQFGNPASARQSGNPPLHSLASPGQRVQQVSRWSARTTHMFENVSKYDSVPNLPLNPLSSAPRAHGRNKYVFQKKDKRKNICCPPSYKGIVWVFPVNLEQCSPWQNTFEQHQNNPHV